MIVIYSFLFLFITASLTKLLAEWDGPAPAILPCPRLEIRIPRCDNPANTSLVNKTSDEGNSSAANANVPPTPPNTKSLLDQTTAAHESEDESAAEEDPAEDTNETVHAPVQTLHPDVLEMEVEIRDLIRAEKHPDLLILRPPSLSGRKQATFPGGVAGYNKAHNDWRDLIREEIDMEGNLAKIPSDSIYHVAVLPDRKRRRTPLKSVLPRKQRKSNRGKQTSSFILSS